MSFARFFLSLSLLASLLGAAELPPRRASPPTCSASMAGRPTARANRPRLSAHEAETILWGAGGQSAGTWEETRLAELDRTWVDKLKLLATEKSGTLDEPAAEAPTDEDVEEAPEVTAALAEAKPRRRRVEAAVRRFHTGIASPVNALAAESNTRIFAGLDDGKTVLMTPREAPRTMATVVDDGKALQGLAYLDGLHSVAMVHPSGAIAFRPQHRKAQEKERRYYRATIAPVPGRRVRLFSPPGAEWLFVVPDRDNAAEIQAVRLTPSDAMRGRAKDPQHPEPLLVFPATGSDSNQVVAFAFHSGPKSFFVASLKSREVRVTPTHGAPQKLKFDADVRWLRSFAVAPSGNRIVGTSDPGKLFVWDRGPDDQWKKPRVLVPVGSETTFYQVHFAPGSEERILLSQAYKAPALVYELGRRPRVVARIAKKMRYGGHPIRFDQFFFSPSGTVLLGVSTEHNRWVAFDTESGRSIPFSGESDEFFYRAGLTVSAATANGMVYLGTKDGNVLALDLLAFEKLR